MRKDAFFKDLVVVSAQWPTSTNTMPLVRRYCASCVQYRQRRGGSTSQWVPSLTEKSGVLRVESSRSIALLQRKCGSGSGSRTPTTRATTRHYATSSSPTILPETELSPPSQPSRQRNLSLDPNAPHHDLATFLAYAQRTGLSTSSTVYNGTLYEYLALDTLRRYGFELYHVGGRGDRGVDLVGVWRIPKRGTSATEDEEDRKKRETTNTAGTGTGTGQAVKDDGYEVLKVLVQCKRLVGKHAKIGPNLIRELDGAVRGARLGFLFESIFPDPTTAASASSATSSGITTSTGHSDNTAPHPDLHKSGSGSGNNNPAIGVLVGTRPATKGVIESLRRSNRGLVWIMLEEVAVNGQLGGNGQTKSDSEKAAVSDADDDATTTTERITHHHQQGETERKYHHLDSDPSAGSYADMEINIETDLEHFHVTSSTTTTATSSPSLPTLVPPKGRVKQIIWNQAARNLGLEDVDVIKRYASTTGGGQRVDGSDEEVAGSGAEEGAKEEEEVVLSRAGRLILG